MSYSWHCFVQKQTSQIGNGFYRFSKFIAPLREKNGSHSLDSREEKGYCLANCGACFIKQTMTTRQEDVEKWSRAWNNRWDQYGTSQCLYILPRHSVSKSLQSYFNAKVSSLSSSHHWPLLWKKMKTKTWNKIKNVFGLAFFFGLQKKMQQFMTKAGVKGQICMIISLVILLLLLIVLVVYTWQYSKQSYLLVCSRWLFYLLTNNKVPRTSAYRLLTSCWQHQTRLLGPWLRAIDVRSF